jgi:hypothetical protein
MLHFAFKLHGFGKTPMQLVLPHPALHSGPTPELGELSPLCAVSASPHPSMMMAMIAMIRNQFMLFSLVRCCVRVLYTNTPPLSTLLPP